MAVLSPRFRAPLPAVLGLTAGALLLAAAPAAAQNFRKITNPPDFETERRLYDMKDGKTSAKIPENKAAIDAVTRMLAYRLTYPQALTLGTKPNEPVTARVDGVNILAIHLAPSQTSRFLKVMPAAGTFKPFEIEYVNEFGRALTDRLKEVLTHPEPIVRVNAAQMLSLIGRTGYDGVVDAYLEILTRKDADLEADAVKFFALRGLKDLLAIPNPSEPNRSVIADVGQERKVARALIDFIQRKPPLSADASREERDAVCYVRREAVRALAQIHQPVLRTAGTLDSEPILTLLRVAVRDAGITPEPSVAEQAEAVLGICRMDDDNAVNLDYLTYYLPTALKELAIARKDQPTVLPWKAYGLHLNRVMAAWKARALLLPASRGGPRVAAVADRAINNLATPLEQGANNAITTGELEAWQKSNPPASTSLVRDDPKATVQPRTGLNRQIQADEDDKKP
jgi:HEAT repeat protein